MARPRRQGKKNWTGNAPKNTGWTFFESKKKKKKIFARQPPPKGKAPSGGGCGRGGGANAGMSGRGVETIKGQTEREKGQGDGPAQGQRNIGRGR